MQNVTTTNWTYLIGFNCDHIKRVTVRAKNLQLIAFMISMNHDNHSDITRFKLVLRQVRRQNNPLMFLNHLSLSSHSNTAGRFYL